MLCPNCGTENRPGARFCVRCGAALPIETTSEAPSPGVPAFAAPPPPPPSYIPPGPPPVEKRYPILRTLSVIYKVLGGIVAALTLLGTIGACITGIAGGAVFRGLERQTGVPIPDIGGVVGGVVAGLIFLLYGGFIALTLYGAGEMVNLFISMEEHIRSLAQR